MKKGQDFILHTVPIFYLTEDFDLGSFLISFTINIVF